MNLLGNILGVTTHNYPCGGWLPEHAKFIWQRSDQGRDFITDWGGVLQAPGRGECVGVGSDRPFPNGFGPKYAIVRLDSGPFAGHEWYLGHCTALVGPRERFGWGHPLAKADQGRPSQIGIHVPGDGGWVELGLRQPGGSLGPFSSSGHWYDDLLRRPAVIRIPRPPIHYGERGTRIWHMTGWLARCGWLDRRTTVFDRAVHGAVVAFKDYHHLPMPPLNSREDRGVVDARTLTAIVHAGQWCKAYHHKDH